MLNERVFWIVVSFLGLGILIVMGCLSYNKVMEFGFVGAWAALMTLVLTIYSSVKSIKNYDNTTHEKNDSEQLSDEHRDKLEKIVEKIIQVHQTVKSIASGRYSREEFVRARKKHDKEYAKHAEFYNDHGYTGMYDEEGFMFEHHFEQSKNLFSELQGLRSSAHLYFGEDVLSIIKNLHEIIESLRSDIGSINIIAGEIGPSPESNREIRKLKESIWSLAWGEVWGNDEDGATQKRLEKFMSIPERVDQVLSKYALKR